MGTLDAAMKARVPSSLSSNASETCQIQSPVVKKVEGKALIYHLSRSKLEYIIRNENLTPQYDLDPRAYMSAI